MASYSWTKSKCNHCGAVERVRGKAFYQTRCFTCQTGQLVWVELHCGPEKYALPYGGKGAVYRNPSLAKGATK